MNLRPLRPERSGDESQPLTPQEFSELLLAVCTRVCTSGPESMHGGPLETLAAALRESLPADECRRLGELLNGDDIEENA